MVYTQTAYKFWIDFQTICECIFVKNCSGTDQGLKIQLSTKDKNIGDFSDISCHHDLKIVYFYYFFLPPYVIDYFFWHIKVAE